MTTAPPEPVGAVSPEPDGWHAINWRAANENVRRLQARIVKATKAVIRRLETASLTGR